MRDMLPMNLQLFAEPAGGAGGEGVGGAQTQQQGAQASQQAASPIIDYAKSSRCWREPSQLRRTRP